MPSDLTTAAAAFETIRTRPGLVLGEATRVKVGGIRGVQFVVETADPDLEARRLVPVFETALGPISIASGRRLEQRLVDTVAGLFAVLVGGSVRRWESTRTAAAPMLDSIVFSSSVGSRTRLFAVELALA